MASKPVPALTTAAPTANGSAAVERALMGPVVDHLARYVGAPSVLVRDTYSRSAPVDLLVVPPSTRFPYYTIVSCGMSRHAMPALAGAEAYRHAELLIALPGDWPIDAAVEGRPAAAWPLEVLQRIARYVQHERVWLFYMQTVPNGQPPRPYATKTRFAGAIIGVPVLYGREFPEIDRADQPSLQLYSIIPLYPEELDWKMLYGPGDLLERLEADRVTELLRPRRAPVIGWRRYIPFAR